jgi:hypothetical protein
MIEDDEWPLLGSRECNLPRRSLVSVVGDNCVCCREQERILSSGLWHPDKSQQAAELLFFLFSLWPLHELLLNLLRGASMAFAGMIQGSVVCG